MSPVEWYYAQNDKQHGPVSPAEIKALADAGKLLPDDLVWREGMEEWIPARKVKGLFASEETPAAKPSQPAPPVAAAPETASPRAPETASPRAPETAPPPAPQADAPSTREAAPPVFEKSPAAFERAREGPARHLFDFVLEFARSQFPAHFVESTSKLFTAIGHYGLYVAMLLLFSFAMILGIKADQLNPVLMGIAGAAVLYVLQYTAGRFCSALVRVNQASPGQVTSTAFLDCWALLNLVLGVVALIGYAVWAIQTESYLLIFTGLATFIICEYMAFVSLNPETLKIAVSADVRAGEEAIGIITFLLKLGLVLAPVAFGVGVAAGIIRLMHCLYLVFQEGEQLAALAAAEATTYSVIYYAALPLVAYLVFLLYYLLIDVIRAVLSLPGKLDKLAQEIEEDEDKDEG